MDRMRFLVETLNNASKAYYQGNSQNMSDYEYDALYDELVALEESTGERLPESPTAAVGYTVLSGLEKVAHTVPMLSLAKTKSVGELAAFLGGEKGLLSWKLDGLTIVLHYENGRLIRAVTRGNGEVGEDITHNARVFKNVPENIAFTGGLALRGEAVISFTDFERLNDSLETGEKYKNPRNLTSGTVRQLNSGVAAGRSVMFFAFALVSADGMGLGDSKQQRLEWLRALGFGVTEFMVVCRDGLEEAVASFQAKIAGNDYATDGLVLTFDSISHSAALGQTSKFPKDSMALKWADETAETTLTSVEWNTSRTGLINPVAVFAPVELEGTTVSRASLHNVSVLEGLALGLGDAIKVYKANMIIPQVAENLTRSGILPLPTACPECGFETEIVKLREGRALRCPNPNCRAQLVRSLSHFASRDAMNIEGLSEATLEKFVAAGFVANYADLYGLGRHSEHIVGMEGFGEKSLANLLEALERSKDAELANFIYALGISHVGLRGAKLLCARFENDMGKIMAAPESELLEIEGFGQVIAASVAHYFANEKNRLLLLSFLPTLRLKRAESGGSAAGSLAGLTFVITGALSRFENRKALQEHIESRGGKVTGSVTGKTSYLINNDASSGSAKNKKAAELNVPVISEEEFITLLLT